MIKKPQLTVKRRTFLKQIGAGIFVFIPIARALARTSGTSVSMNSQFIALNTDAFAGITISDTAAAVLAALGKPLLIQPTHGNGSPEWHYSDLIVRFLPDVSGEQRVQTVLSTSRTRAIEVAATVATPAQKIRVGSPVAELKRAYGAALIDYGPGGLSLHLSGDRHLDFVHENDVLSLLVLRSDTCSSCAIAPGNQTPERSA